MYVSCLFFFTFCEMKKKINILKENELLLYGVNYIIPFRFWKRDSKKVQLMKIELCV